MVKKLSASRHSEVLDTREHHQVICDNQILLKSSNMESKTPLNAFVCDGDTLRGDNSVYTGTGGLKHKISEKMDILGQEVDISPSVRAVSKNNYIQVKKVDF